MDFNHLRTFIAVATHGHLTRAAETLHLSQPAVSGQIRALEETLGFALFERSPSGMSLTPRGRTLLADAERAVGALQRFQQAARRLRGEIAGRLILGTILDPAALRVGPLLARAMERHPQLALELRHVVSHEALAGVRDGTLDASFYFGSRPAGDCHGVKLRDIRYRVAMPAAWSSLASAPWEALRERPWIAAPETSSHRELVQRVFRARSSQPTRLVEADNEPVIADLIASGVGISVLRDEVAQPLLEQRRIVVWPASELTTTLWLTFLASRRDDPLVEALLGVLEDVWADVPEVRRDVEAAVASDPR